MNQFHSGLWGHSIHKKQAKLPSPYDFNFDKHQFLWQPILFYCIMKGEVFPMPEISMFFGIRITIYYNDHNPPHIHAEYAGNKALIDIQDSCVIQGFLPGRQLKLVLAWCVMYQDELMQNWELVKDGKEPNPVPPMRKG